MNVYLKHGLSNRIRTMLGYLYIAKEKSVRLHLLWIPDKECNGHFRDLFENINGICFLDEKNAKIKNRNFDFIGQETFHNIIIQHFPTKSFNDIEKIENELYGLLKPKQHIKFRVGQFFNKNNVSELVAFHIRRTDHIDLAKSVNKYADDDYFINIMRNSTDKLFLATDNALTQSSLYKMFKGRLSYYKRIIENGYTNKNNRNTTLDNALVDILIC